MNTQKPRRFGGFSFYIVMMLVILAVTFFMSRGDRQKQTSLYEVEQLIQSGDVHSVTMDGSSWCTNDDRAVKAGTHIRLKRFRRCHT